MRRRGTAIALAGGGCDVLLQISLLSVQQAYMTAGRELEVALQMLDTFENPVYDPAGCQHVQVSFSSFPALTCTPLLHGPTSPLLLLLWN